MALTIDRALAMGSMTAEEGMLCQLIVSFIEEMALIFSGASLTYSIEI